MTVSGETLKDLVNPNLDPAILDPAVVQGDQVLHDGQLLLQPSPHGGLLVTVELTASAAPKTA